MSSASLAFRLAPSPAIPLTMLTKTGGLSYPLHLRYRRSSTFRSPTSKAQQGTTTMAKRFWAQLIELDEPMTPSAIPGATDHESAAENLVADFVGAMGGEITSGAVRVWIDGGLAKTYDWNAEFEMPDTSDLLDDEDIEVEGEIVLTERVRRPD